MMSWGGGYCLHFNYIFRGKFTQLLVFGGTGKVFLNGGVSSLTVLAHFLDLALSEMTFESPQVRLFLQQYLLNSLVSTNNVFVKMKVLKIFQVGTNKSLSLINHMVNCDCLYVTVCVCVCLRAQVLLDDGHIEFKQNLRKHPEAFNEASSMSIFVYLYVYMYLFVDML